MWVGYMAEGRKQRLLESPRLPTSHVIGKAKPPTETRRTARHGIAQRELRCETLIG